MTYTAKIYKIVNTINDDIYIGSSRNELRKRFQQHKSASKTNPEQNLLYKMMSENDISCFRIVLCHEFECENKEQQIKEEQKIIDELKPKLNKHNASGNKCEHNKIRCVCKICDGVSICQHNVIRYNCKQCSGTGICEHNKQKSICKNCKGGSICQHEKRKSRCRKCGGVSSQKVKCECGSEIIKSSMSNHLKTKKHQDFIHHQEVQTYLKNI